MLLKRVKKALQDIGYTRNNRVQEKLNQYGDLLQELEIDLADLNMQIRQIEEEEQQVTYGVKGVIEGVFFKRRLEEERNNREVRKSTLEREISGKTERVKNIEELIEEERQRADKIAENIRRIENARNFQELDIKSIEQIKKVLDVDQLILESGDENVYITENTRKNSYLILGFNTIEKDMVSSIYPNEEVVIKNNKSTTISTNVQEFNINSINGIKDTRYLAIIPAKSIQREDILGMSRDNKIILRKADILKGCIIIAPEQDLKKITYEGVEKIGYKGKSATLYAEIVLDMLGETLSDESIDIKSFREYSNLKFPETDEINKDAIMDLQSILKIMKGATIDDVRKPLLKCTKYESAVDILIKALGKDYECIDFVIEELKKGMGLQISEQTKLIIEFAKGNFNINSIENKLGAYQEEINLYKMGKVTKKDILLYALIRDYEKKITDNRNISGIREVNHSYEGTNLQIGNKKHKERRVGKKEYNLRVSNIFHKVEQICSGNEELGDGQDLFIEVNFLYKDTTNEWKKMHSVYNYDLELENKRYKIRPEKVSKEVKYDDEKDLIYNLGKTIYTMNKLAHLYTKQVDILIKNKFGLNDLYEITKVKSEARELYESEKDTPDYKERFYELKKSSKNRLETNQLQALIERIGKRLEQGREAFKCKDYLIEYLVDRLGELPADKKNSYTYGYMVDNIGTMLVMDIPYYDQLRVHVVDEEMAEGLKSKMSLYPLNVLTENRGNILVRGLNKELETKLKAQGTKCQIEEYIKDNMDEKQIHEVLLLMGYHGDELINAMSSRRAALTAR